MKKKVAVVSFLLLLINSHVFEMKAVKIVNQVLNLNINSTFTFLSLIVNLMGILYIGTVIGRSLKTDKY